ncbi:hypothetical protein C8F01DRAFT_1376607 [Mycena amicta]|nr:hypothetical protein C8F01DRAFT_1376607 [Mycena amicta]
MSSEFPNELWTEVFGGVSQTDLVHVATASRTFCALARPFLFADFEFHPYAVSFSGDRFLPPQETMESATERLNFWMSAEVAVLVQTCTITPWPFSSFVKKHWSGIYGEAGCILLDAFVDKMERFTRLRSLRALDVDFHPLTPTKLAALTSLRDLVVFWENPNDDRREFTVSRTIPLTSFTYFSTAESTRDPSPYLPLLDPASLRQLTIFCTSDAARVIPQRQEYLHSRANLAGDAGAVPLCGATQPSSLRCRPVAFGPRIRPDLPHDASTFLHITNVKAETQYDFPSMLAPFPGLTSLSIHLGILTGETNSTVARQLFTALTPALPQTLRELTICFSFTALDNNRPPSDESDPYSVRDAILARCSQLQSMIIHAEDWFFSGKQSAVAEPTEKFIHRVYGKGANELGGLKEKILSSWEFLGI